MTTLTQSEIQLFTDLRTQAQLGNIGYWNIYQQLADLLVTKGVSATDPSLLWLRGAAEANAGRGAFSALIRGYTQAQYQTRYGTAIPTGDLQRGIIRVRFQFP